MRNGTITPSISVEIGGQLRVYQAFVTTAKPALDGPSTLTLYASDFADVAAFAATPIPFNRELGRKLARVVLVNSTELEWHRATYRSEPLSLRSGGRTAHWTAGAAALVVAAPVGPRCHSNEDCLNPDAPATSPERAPARNPRAS